MSDTPQTNTEHIMEALQAVIDPEIGMNVVDLGLIRHLDLQPDQLHITMILTTPFCPDGPQMLEQTRRAAQEAAGVPTTVEMGLEMWDPSMMAEGAGGDWGLF